MRAWIFLGVLAACGGQTDDPLATPTGSVGTESGTTTGTTSTTSTTTPAPQPTSTWACRSDIPADQLTGAYPPEELELPQFLAYNYTGAERHKPDLQGHVTVVWFYPAANTGGWTIEGCGYRDLYNDFQALGVEIVGVSFDTTQANEEFATAQGFQYELWSDLDRTLALHFGAATSDTQAFASRKTFVLDEQGRLCLQYESVGVSSHPQEVLEDVTLLLSSTATTGGTTP